MREAYGYQISIMFTFRNNRGSGPTCAGSPKLARSRVTGSAAELFTWATCDPSPGTTSGNHRAYFPRHPRTSPAMVSAGRVDELTSLAWADPRPCFALQARSRWFEPTCAHQVFAVRWRFVNTNRITGNHSREPPVHVP